jgi:hypothetical protein
MLPREKQQEGFVRSEFREDANKGGVRFVHPFFVNRPREEVDAHLSQDASVLSEP